MPISKPYSLIRGLSQEYLRDELQRLLNLWDASRFWVVIYNQEKWRAIHQLDFTPEGKPEALTPVDYAEQAVVQWCHELGTKHGITEGPSPLKGIV